MSGGRFHPEFRPAIRRAAAVCCLLFATCLQAALGSDAGYDWGPFACHDVTLEGFDRTRVLGPFYEKTLSSSNVSFLAIRPVATRRIDSNMQEMRLEYLWPLATSKDLRTQRTSRFLSIFHWDFDSHDPLTRSRFWAFPLYFQGRDIHGTNYAALFPVMGSVHEMLGMDRIEFFLFPMFLRTERADIKTTSFMWPLVSYTRGNDIEKVSVFPLYGQSIKQGSNIRTYILWPIWTTADFKDPKRGTGYGYVLFPVYGRLMSDREKTWMLMPPLFRMTIRKDGRELHMPWPFIQFSSGKVTREAIWPLIGTKREENMQSAYFAWPFISTWQRWRKNETVRNTAILPFLQYEVRYKRPKDEGPSRNSVTAKFVKIWPMISSKDTGAKKTIKIPALWPGPEIQAIERNFVPLWTLYSQERIGDSVENEILWGLIRNRETPTSSRLSAFPLVSASSSHENGGHVEWTILKGLLGYERTGTKQYMQMFYLKWGKAKDIRMEAREDAVGGLNN